MHLGSPHVRVVNGAGDICVQDAVFLLLHNIQTTQSEILVSKDLRVGKAVWQWTRQLRHTSAVQVPEGEASRESRVPVWPPCRLLDLRPSWAWWLLTCILCPKTLDQTVSCGRNVNFSHARLKAHTQSP